MSDNSHLQIAAQSIESLEKMELSVSTVASSAVERETKVMLTDTARGVVGEGNCR
jgi:hypothetical protein